MRAAPGLDELPLATLAQLGDAGELCEFEPGELLMAEDDPAHEIYLLLEGSVSVEKRAIGSPSTQKIARRVAPDWLGDFAVLDAGARSASVIAEASVLALRLPREAFLETLVSNVSAMLAMLRTLTLRVRESDAQLIEALGQQVEALSSENRQLSRDVRRLHHNLDEVDGFRNFVGASHAARATRELARVSAESELPVLLLGETGTGKELLARAIHAASESSAGSFVAINCSLVTETLLESELFGYARGAFTGATQAKVGLVEAADGGTLFLDEIADMSASLQGALLRFLELGEYRRLGETRVRTANARIIAATHRDVDEANRSGEFRSDLLYRLDVVRISIPPLRERGEDLPLLAAHCIQRVARRLGVEPLQLDPGASALLASYDYPGNVRELENEIERLYAFLPAGSTVHEASLSPKLAGNEAGSARGYADLVKSFKIRLVENALREAGGNRSRAAERLGVHRSNLGRMIRDLGV